MTRSPSFRQLLTPLLAASLYTCLSACGPAPTAGPSAAPTAAPTASPTANPSAPPSAAPAKGPLRLRLQADASLAGFATAQDSGFTLCLSRIAAAETSLSAGGSSLPLNRRPLTLKDLLAGIEIEVSDVPAGTLSGRTAFLDAAGAELGFVTWQATLNAEGGTVSVTLSATAETRAAEACPRLNASVSGGSLQTSGGKVTSPSPAPSSAPATPPASPTSAPTGSAPATPANLQLVERGTSYLTLKWEFASEPVSYRLYLDGQPVVEHHTSPDYYRFTNLATASEHTLGVQALSPTGIAGEIATLTGSTLSSGSTATGNFSSGGNSGGGTSSRPRQQDEFQVNTYTPNDQYNIDAAADSDGNYVVVWQSFGQDGDNYGVYGQRYDADGETLGEEFQINTFTLGSQERPRVDTDADGNFVVAWYGAGPEDSAGIYARRFDADGEPEGAPFLLNAYTSSAQIRPDISLNDDGSFVAVWSSDNQNAGNDSVYGRVFSAADVGGSELLINSFTTIGESAPAVAGDDDGNFVVVWHALAPDEDAAGIFGRRYTVSGSPLTAPFKINTYTTSNQATPQIAMDSDGDFVVTWESDAEDGDGDGIYARRYAPDTQALDQPFCVTQDPEDDQYQPKVAIRDGGDFVITWSHETLDDQSGETRFRRYESSGEPVGRETQANQNEVGFQGTPAIAMSPDGDILVLWESSPEPDGLQYGVYGRLYRQ